ncbi:MAG TPA: zinc-binding dehydrogenase [Polyangia bacterium]|jgi:NADPH:quinone reductase-like Zn-dependent oxidoreductase
MRAVLFHEHGGIDRLKYEAIATPRPGPTEILVTVQACAVNHLDLWVRRGLPGLRLPLPHVTGADVAGVVAEVGAGVTNVKPGDAVVLNPGVSCGHCRECLAGRDNLCRAYGLLGEHCWGGYAEQVVVPAVNAVPAPPGVPVAEVAALPTTFLTAWQMLYDRAQVRPGETVLVLAAASGVGTAAIQLAKLGGAQVIAAASSEAKLAAASALGADHLVNSARQDLLAEVRRLTGRRGVDIVFEHTGADTWPTSILCAARGGRITTCGATSGYDARTDLRYVFSRQLTILGSTMAAKGRLFDLVALQAAGRIRPQVTTTLPLERAAEAHKILEDRQVIGKVVLVP